MRYEVPAFRVKYINSNTFYEVIFMLRKLSVVLALCLVLAVSCSACASVRVGALSKLNVDDSEFGIFQRSTMWTNLSRHSGDDVIVFYDTIMSMLMSLGAGDIDEVDLPGIVGAYVLNSRPDYKISCVVRTKPEYLAFGFLKDKNESLRDKFNEALKAIKDDGTLSALTARYMKVDGLPESVEFERFPAADTVRVAVTGDLPPIDYVGTDGKAAGFNTALLAEIAKRLKVNIKLVYVNSGSRTAALTSGRADVVFWYQLTEGNAKQYDVPDSVIVSDAYYDWNTFTHISQKTLYRDE